MDPIEAAIKKVEAMYANVVSKPEASQNIYLGINKLDKLVNFRSGGVLEITGTPNMKTTIAYRIAGSLQKQMPNKVVVWVASNFIYNIQWAEKNGVDNSKIVLLNENDINKILDVLRTFINYDACSLIVIDDIPSLWVDDTNGDDEYIARAKAIARAIKRLRQMCSVHNTSVILINQIKNEKGESYGGSDISRLSDVILTVNDSYRDDIGVISSIRISKNKFGVAYKTVKIRLKYNIGILD